MKRFIAVLLGCSLAFAVGVRAEQENPNNPKKKKAVQQTTAVPKQQFTPKQHTVPNTHVQGVNAHHNVSTVPNNAKIHNANVSKQQFHKGTAVQTNKVPVVESTNVPAVQSNKLVPAVQKNKLPAVQTTKVPSVQPDQAHAVGANKLVPAVQKNKVPGVQTNQLPGVQANQFQGNKQKFHMQHQNFHAKPNPAVASATFNQHYRINGAQNWNGAHYAAFRSYHPQWHNRNWWHSHHNHIVLIGGGWYFWNAGYWYPAWGYDTSAAYYPYDGPIYAGQSVTPLDQVIADVQAALQEQGYYSGEVDGLLGPLTQQALAEYQAAQGLDQTAAIDQPTLESLGLG